MDPKDLWDVENLFDLVENNHNKFENGIEEYKEFENKIDNNFYDFSEDDLPY